MLQTYDRELKARETYTYGHGRSSYLDNQTDKSYDYLTNQAGSVTGLVQDGSPVASISYNLYGSTEESTDDTGNPFAYNGEARDSTGLDYLRARYYDSSAGTFLTEDTYQGELTDPLSQNRYSYVHNNPVNYTDPSGHFWKSIKKAASNAWNGAKKVVSNAWNTVKKAVTPTVNRGGRQGNPVKNRPVQQRSHSQSRRSPQSTPSRGNSGGSHTSSTSRAYVQQQKSQARGQTNQRRQRHIRDEYSQSTGVKKTPKTREAKSMFRNWGKALKEMYTHVCKTADRVKKQVANYVKKIDWKKVAVTAGAIGVGIALTVATGGLGAPVAMAIGGAASGAIMSGYDAYSSGQRGWALVGSIAKGAGTGALAGFIGGQFLGAGANVAANVTQNISNQVVRQVAKVGVESAVETAIDTGIDLAVGNQITGQTVAMNFAFNTFTNGAGSVSSKKGAKADVPKNKPKSGDVAIPKTNTDEYVTYRRVQGGGKGTATSQSRIDINSDGTISISKQDKDLNISIDNGEHSAYYLKNKRPGGEIVEFEVPKWMDDFRKEYTVPQTGYKTNPNNQGGMAPKVTDMTTPGHSVEFPAPWVEWIEEYAVNARVVRGN